MAEGQGPGSPVMCPLLGTADVGGLEDGRGCVSDFTPMHVTCWGHINPHGRNCGPLDKSTCPRNLRALLGTCEVHLHVEENPAFLSGEQNRHLSLHMRKELNKVTESDFQGPEGSYPQLWTVLRRNQSAH